MENTLLDVKAEVKFMEVLSKRIEIRTGSVTVIDYNYVQF